MLKNAVLFNSIIVCRERHNDLMKEAGNVTPMAIGIEYSFTVHCFNSYSNYCYLAVFRFPTVESCHTANVHTLPDLASSIH